MKRARILTMLIVCSCVLAAIATVAAHHAKAQAADRKLETLIPQGALLYLEAKDWGGLLQRWERSPQEQDWIKSDSYSMFSRSRLFGRLAEAQAQFAQAAGIPPDNRLLQQAAGRETALAIFDIGKLEMLYITRLPESSPLQMDLWQARGKFEQRESAGRPFYLRRDAESSRVFAFAVTDGMLILATREDLVAGALERLNGANAPSMQGEPWFQDAVAATKAPGDLRMVLNLERIAATPYFRSYWIQQNITEMKQYRAAICDLFMEGAAFRDQRVLLPKSPLEIDAEQESALPAPPNASFYRGGVVKSAKEATARIRTLLRTNSEQENVRQTIALGPVESEETAGSAGDLETRIDVAPFAVTEDSAGATAALEKIIDAASAQSYLQTFSSRRHASGVFVSLDSALMLTARRDWNVSEVLEGIAGELKPGNTTAAIGLQWVKEKTPIGDIYHCDGLIPFFVLVSDKQLALSNSSAALQELMGSPRTAHPDARTSFAAFYPAKERGNYEQLVRLLAHSPNGRESGEQPDFFAGNIASLGRTFAALQSIEFSEKKSPARVDQTTTYTWSR